MGDARIRYDIGFILFFFLYYGASAITIVFLPLVLQDKGLTSLEIGAFLAVGPIVSLMVQPIWGFVADRFGRIRIILLLALCGTLMAAAGLFAVQEKLWLVICFIFYTMFSCTIIPLLDTWNLSYCERRGASYGKFRLCGSLGFAFTSIVLGWLAVEMGLSSMVVLFAVSISLSALVLLLLNMETAPLKRNNSSYWKGMSGLFKDRRLWLFVTFLFFLGLPARAVESFYGLYIIENGGTTLLVGIGWALACLSEVPVLAVVNRWVTSRGLAQLLIIAGLAYAIRWALPLVSMHPWWLVGIQISHGLTHALFFVAAVQFIRELTPPELRSSAQSILVIMLFTLPGILGGSLGGWMMDSGHSSWLFLFASLGTGTAVVLWLVCNLSAIKDKANADHKAA
jgi:MFS transporter, PPP family, 3-phenylpropionic acid transporter